MADMALAVIGGAASIASLVQIAGQVAIISYGYIGAVKGAPKEIQALADELEELKEVLGNLANLEEQNTLQTNLGGSLKKCALELEKLEAKIEIKPADRWRRRFKRLRWPLQLAETSQILGRLERYKSLFALALTADQRLLLQAIEVYTQRTDLGVGELQRCVQDIQAKLAAKSGAQAGEKRASALEWLYPDSFDQKHQEIHEKRQDHTGIWLSMAPEFQDWTKESPDCRLLWGYGIPGAGKTFLSSRVIDDLEDQANEADYGVAYIYFNSKEQHQQTPIHILASLTKQLAAKKQQLPNEIEALYDEQKGIKKPNFDDLQAALLAVSKLFRRVFFVFDALDECEPSSLEKLLLLFHSLGKHGASIFMTSRRYYEAIERSLCDVPKIELAANDGDIKVYVEERIKNHHLFQNDKDRDTAVSELVKCSHGMFLLVRFYLDDICQSVKVRQVRAALDKLKSTGSLSQEKALEGVYGRVMEKINAGHPSRRDLALKILSWLVRTQVTLTVNQLRVAVAVEEGRYELHETDLSKRETLLEVCSGLATISEKNNTIQLAHLSVQDYLVKKKGIPECANFELAMACVTFLSFEIFTGGACVSPDSLETRLELHPFLSYAATQLPFYLQACDENLSLEIVLKFLKNAGSLSSFLQVWRKLAFHPFYFYPNLYEIEQESPLHLASFLGHSTAVQRLLEEGAELDISVRDRNSHMALHLAAGEGHQAVVQLLLKRGADLSVPDNHGRTALHWAAAKGRKAVIQLLLDEGADISIQDLSGETALHWTAMRGHVTAFQLLLEKGADFEVQDNHGQTALHWAAVGGHVVMVQLLLLKGADISIQAPNGETALHLAAANGHITVSQLLLENGADTSIQNKYRRTALHRAAMGGYGAVVKLLLEKGTNTSAKSRDGDTALHESAYRGHGAVVQLLLEKDANISEPNNKGDTALHKAAYRGHQDMVQLLLEKGANISELNYKGDTALHQAAYKGHKTVAQLLLKEGIDISIQNKYGESALHKAASEGHEVVVKLLLENGANISEQNNKGDTALHEAVYKGHEAVSQLLLEKGADTSIQDKYGETALHKAASEGHETVAQLLLAKGANISIQDWHGIPALQCAAWGGNKALVQLLLDMGADISIQDKDGDTALHEAAIQGHGAVAQLLLENGADTSVLNENGRTALHEAASGGYEAVVKILLEKGVDTSIQDKSGDTAFSVTKSREVASLLETALQDQAGKPAQIG